MDFNNTACTAAQAIRLQQLGITAPSYLISIAPLGESHLTERRFNLHLQHTCNRYNTSELGVMLPHRIEVDKVLLHLTFVKDFDSPYSADTLFSTGYFDPFEAASTGEWKWSLRSQDITEAKSRADMLILLLERGIVSAEVVNNRLNKA